MSISETDAEQQHVDVLYARLDALRARVDDDLRRVRRAGASGTPQARSERDAFATLYEDRLAQLHGVEERLCFGRLDMVEEAPRYIGRLGLFDDDQTQLLVDWRAPAARDFYQATSRHPGGVVRRRHLETQGRRVTAIYDDVLDLDTFEARPDLVAHTSESSSLTTDGALLAALNAHRTGRMGDIVATIQSEQDEIVRSPLQGVLVVQGGPGTGKTAVALHRAAYLLYTHRDRLESRGVLLVGPSPVFLRYISQVLPSLGETGVVTATPAELFPGVEATGSDGDRTVARRARCGWSRSSSGRSGSACACRRKSARSASAVSRCQLRPRVVRSAVETARRGGRPHNAARITFVRTMLQSLIDLYANASGDTPESVDRSYVEEVLRDAVDVRRELNLAWPPLAAEQVLADLFASPERLFAATPGWSNDERALLLRGREEPWTTADVALLDEVAELVGEDDAASASEAHREQRAAAEEVRHAREVLETIGGRARQLVTAETLAERFATTGPTFTVAERAYGDRTWSYGHVIVDEAQELSPMQWRLLIRRCPTKSFTLVGDMAQATGPAVSRSWAEALSPHVGDAWVRRDLTINYRTPARVMEQACAMLEEAGYPTTPPTSVREGDEPVGVELLDREALTSVVVDELQKVGQGRVAVITSAHESRAVKDLLAPWMPAVDDVLLSPLVVLTAEQAKGLEFDRVVVVDPDAIAAEGPHGARALFVAMTRPTQRLVLAHPRPSGV